MNTRLMILLLFKSIFNNTCFRGGDWVGCGPSTCWKHCRAGCHCDTVLSVGGQRYVKLSRCNLPTGSEVEHRVSRGAQAEVEGVARQYSIGFHRSHPSYDGFDYAHPTGGVKGRKLWGKAEHHFSDWSGYYDNNKSIYVTNYTVCFSTYCPFSYSIVLTVM